MRRLGGRFAVAAVGGAAFWVVLGLIGDAPRVVPLAGIVLVIAAVGGAIYDALAWHGPTWPAPAPAPSTTPGRDRHLAVYERILDSNATSDVPDERLRDSLRRLVDLRLEQRHGLTRDDPMAADLLGQDLLRLLAAPPRRVSRRELDAHLRRIEEL